MAETSIYGLPYLEPADEPDIAAATQGLAQDVETELARIDTAVTALKTRSASKRASPRTTEFGLSTSFSPDLQSVSVPGDGTTVYEIVCLVPAVYSTVSGDRVEVGLFVAGVQVGGAYFEAAGGAANGATIVAEFTPTVSAQTVSMRARRVGGSGTCSYYASSSTPGRLYARPL